MKQNLLIKCSDSLEEIQKLNDKSIKLLYGSPPYPNANRNYDSWSIEKYIDKISPFLIYSLPKLKDDGFIVINVKSNRTKSKKGRYSSERSLIVEELMIYMKKILNLYCVDIEIWIKTNPVPTGVRVACQDAYEYNLWFSKSPIWEINIDEIRETYSEETLKIYEKNVYKPRNNGLKYVSKEKRIKPNPKGALPKNYFNNIENIFNDVSKTLKREIISGETNIVHGATSNKKINHQAIQPSYLPEKYIKACTKKGDIVFDPWLGSGTTAVAAINLERKFIGFEKNRDFYKIAIERINKETKIGN
ncbi:DNA-methyltransferase [Mycoplasmopsis lipofaciens]|uniref:DNA-methyltransferase n=1 Tax=Mycoplasmopsis lipofaciens TaxID=114884 RepID=UPI000483D538|nr:site-specific DNA-methyltransferase [Mycoplasmopsis lipofaciens]